MGKLFIALYDEQKLIGAIFQHTLEKFHKYDVLFSAASEKELFDHLNAEVKLLLFHVPDVDGPSIRIMEKVLNTFHDIKILSYSRFSDVVHSRMNHHRKRFLSVSVLHRPADFFDGLMVLLPEHINHHRGEESKKEYNLTGFEKIRKNRKWIIIIQCLENGMRPKEMEEITGLKWNTIHSYIEQMQRETGCRNQIELVVQARKKGVV